MRGEGQNMKFSEKLKKAMQQLGLNQAQVVGMTGKSKGSISMYLNGKTVPPEKVQGDIAVSLGLAPDYFGQEEPVSRLLGKCGVIPKLLPEDVAKLMRMDKKNVRLGLQQGVFEWGYGIVTSVNPDTGKKHWTYFINAAAFARSQCIEVPPEMVR